MKTQHTPEEIEERFKVSTKSYNSARVSGYLPLTTPYFIGADDDSIRQRDLEFFRRAIKTMQGTNFIVVLRPAGPEIWRHNSELDVIAELGVKLF
jgi:hypothetical protein